MNKIFEFKKIADEVAQILSEKNTAYGDSFAKGGCFLKLLYPNGIKIEQYKDMLSIVRILDKLMRIATKKDAFGESPWMDIIGYSILAERNNRSEKWHDDDIGCAMCNKSKEVDRNCRGD